MVNFFLFIFLFYNGFIEILFINIENKTNLFLELFNNKKKTINKSLPIKS